MALEDLDIELNLKITKAQESLRRIRLDIHDAFKEMASVKKEFVDIGKSAQGIPTQQIDVRLKNLAAMNRSAEKFLLQTSNLERQFGRNVREAIGAARKEMQALHVETQRVDTAAKSVSSSTGLIHVPRRESSGAGAGGGGGDTGGGVNFVRVTQAAGQLAILSKVSTTLQRIGNTVASVGDSSLVSATKMDRFRLGLSAAKVDPKLNVAKTAIDATGTAVAGFIEKARGIGDATITGIPATIAAIGGALGKIVNSGDGASATLSKLLSQLQTNSAGLQIFKAVFPGTSGVVDQLQAALGRIIPTAEGVANRVDAVTAQAAEMANMARGAAYVATGSFQKLGGSADLMARSTFYALLPLRLLKREMDGANRVVRASMHVFNFVTSPIHAVSIAVNHGRAEWQNLNGMLPQVTTTVGFLRNGISALATRMMQSAASTSLFARSKAALTEKVARARQSVNEFVSAGLGRLNAAFGPTIAKVTAAGSAIVAMAAKLEIGKRAYRTFAQTAFVTGTAVRTFVTVMKPIVSGSAMAARGVWSLIGAMRSMTTTAVRATGVQNTFIGRLFGIKPAADQAAAALAKLDRTSSAGTSRFGGMLAGLGLVRGGLLAAGVAAIAMGAKSAAGAEMSAVSYGTILHDMEQGKALLATVQGWKGAPLFDTKDVEDSTRALLKAGVAPAMITDKLTELGNIASVTKTPLEDLARMYQQGATVGKFGYGQINDMAMRGIDIWHGLADSMGMSVPAVQKLAGAGQIGVAQMDAALAKLTTGTGIYAGAIDNVGETSSGMFSTMVNNIKMSWTAFVGAGLEAFKPVLKMGVAVTGGIATAFRKLAPIAGIFGGAISDMFGAIGRIGGTVFGNLLGNGSGLFSGILKIATTVFTTMRFFWQNFEGVVKWAFESFKYYALSAFNDFLFFFTNQAPHAVKHYFEQVKNLMTGGQWQPLGPMPERAMSDAEKKLKERADKLGEPLAVRLDEMLTEAEKAMADTPVLKALSDKATALDASAPDFGAAGSASRGAIENKAVNVRSAESQSIISQLLNRGQNLQTKAHNAQIKMADDVKKVAKAAERGVPLMARAWA